MHINIIFNEELCNYIEGFNKTEWIHMKWFSCVRFNILYLYNTKQLTNLLLSFMLLEHLNLHYKGNCDPNIFKTTHQGKHLFLVYIILWYATVGRNIYINLIIQSSLILFSLLIYSIFCAVHSSFQLSHKKLDLGVIVIFSLIIRPMSAWT